MKIALLSTLAAALLGLAPFASAFPLSAADLTAILFTTGLVAWTLAQYSRQPRALTLARPIRFSINPAVSVQSTSRLAA